MVGHRAVTTAEDGYVLAYCVWPKPDAATTLVLLNGIMSHAEWFFPLVGPLRAGDVHIVGADRRGSGFNEKDRGDAPSAKTLVGDVVRIIEAEHASSRELVLVGWCWGSVLATHVALHLKDRVDRLVFVAPGFFPSDEVRARARRIDAEGKDLLESPVQEGMFTTGPYLDGFILEDERRLRRMTRRFFELMGRMNFGAAAKLSRLSPPILVLLAEDDRATDNTRTEAAFAGSKDVTVERIKAGHGIQFDAPDETARLILSWMG